MPKKLSDKRMVVKKIDAECKGRQTTNRATPKTVAQIPALCPTEQHHGTEKMETIVGSRHELHFLLSTAPLKQSEAKGQQDAVAQKRPTDISMRSRSMLPQIASEEKERDEPKQ